MTTKMSSYRYYSRWWKWPIILQMTSDFKSVPFSNWSFYWSFYWYTFLKETPWSSAGVQLGRLSTQDPAQVRGQRHLQPGQQGGQRAPGARLQRGACRPAPLAGARRGRGGDPGKLISILVIKRSNFRVKFWTVCEKLGIQVYTTNHRMFDNSKVICKTWP